MKHTEYIVPIGEEAKEFDEIFIGVLRKHKELIRCKDCKYYGRADKRRFYRGEDCINGHISTIVPEKDFCSRAERKEE